ncbi:MAG: low molecular weight protein arginine phosphatase, partial [Anaerolineaceae bacterium]|nr:low molecular weight protein arginine phosphatase [Anaerolineaceae bacterium]
VCTGNICRSPMAAALLPLHLSGLGTATDWQISSAGTWTSEGQPAAAEAIQAMAERGCDIRAHRSRLVNEYLLNHHSLILTMALDQKQALQQEFPFYADQVFMLSEMSNVQVNVPDPSGGTLNQFRAVASQIDRLIQRGLPKIIELAA